MDETKEVIQEEQAVEESHETEQQTDWKAEARKWEERAKKNKAAADELEAIKQERMTEQEKLQARAEAAEAKVAELEAEAMRKASAQRIAAEKHVPIELLLYCSDEQAMESFAEQYAAEVPTPSAPSAPSTRIVRDEKASVSTRDQFAAQAAQFFTR